MLLRQIKIENFLSHEKVDLLFPADGTFLLSGHSGAGKSSLIVDALAYSLYGAVATRGKKQVDLRNNDNPNTSMRVETLWEFNDELLVVARGMDEKNLSWAKAYQPDENGESILLAEGAKPVARLLTDRLGSMSWQQFYSAFVARQSEITLLTTLKGAQRKDLIHQMLGMRELEKAEQLITQKLRRNRATSDQIQKSLGGLDLEEERDRLDVLKKSRQSIQEEKAECQKTIENIKSDLKRTETEINEKKSAAEGFRKKENLETEIDLLSKAVENSQEAVEKHERAVKTLAENDPEKLAEEIKELEEQRDSLRDLFTRSKEHSDLAKKLTELDSELNKEEKEIEGVLRSLPEIPETELLLRDGDLSQFRQILALLGKGIESLQEEGEKLLDRFEKLKNDRECFVCQRPFSTEHSHQEVLQNLEDSIEQNSAQLVETKTAYDSLDKLTGPVDSFLRRSGDRDNIKNQIEALEVKGVKSLDEIKTAGKNVSRDLDIKGETRTRLEAEKMNLNHQVATDYKQQVEKLALLKKELESLAEFNSEAESDYNRLMETKSKQEIELGNTEGIMGQLEKRETEAEEGIHEQEKTLKGREHEFQRLDEIRHSVEICDSTTKMIRGYQLHLAKEIRPALEEIASEMITRISNGKHTALFINDEYEISVKKASGAIVPAALLSGGEEIRANICLRLALTRLVSQRTGVPVNFLVLDEPLPAQDSGHVERIMELFESLRPFYRQQFIISHVGDLRSNDNVDYVLEFDVDENEKRTVQLVNA